MTGAHGRLRLDAGACTACMACARECPDWCIHIEAHRERVEGGRRPRVVNVVDRFAIDLGRCLLCGICVEVCPERALSWHAGPPAATDTAADLVEEMDRLSGGGPAPTGDPA